MDVSDHRKLLKENSPVAFHRLVLRLSIVSTKSDPETEMIIEQPTVRKPKSMLGLLRDKFICITIGKCKLSTTF